MRNPSFAPFHFALAVLLFSAMGCGNKVGPPAPLTLDQFGQVFGEAFKKAKPEVKDLANEVVACVQSNAYARAYSGLQSLSSVPELTKEQSTVIGRGMIAVNGLLQEAAAKGDANAANAMKTYRTTK